MAPVVAHNRDKILQLCQRYGLQRLELFGSAALSDEFDPNTSDIDFLYVMKDEDRDDLADRYFSFHEELERTLGTPVDLVSLLDLKNPYFIASADRSRTLLYPT